MSRSDGNPVMFPVKPKRKPGEKGPGRLVALRTNLYKLFIRQNIDIHESYAEVEWAKDDSNQPGKGGDTKSPAPRKIGNHFRREAVDAAIRKWASNNRKSDNLYWVTDNNGSIIYSLCSFFPKDARNDASFSLTVSIQVEEVVGQKLENVEKRFVVKIMKGTILRMGTFEQYCANKISADREKFMPHVRALNVILRSKINKVEHMVLTPLNIFPFKREEQFKVSEGVIINRGYSTSFRPSEFGPLLNVANTVAAFHEEIDLVNLLQARFGVKDLNRPLRPDIIEKLFKEVKNKQVHATHINYGKPNKPHYRKYRVTAISSMSADQEKFTLADLKTKTHREISIVDYFKEQYKLRLKYPKLPCVVDNGRKIPMELCHLVEKQRILRKMDPKETSNIIKQAALPPERHFALVDKNVKELTQYKGPLLDFGLDFEPKPVEVNGRELTPFMLIDGSGQSIAPRFGQYESRNRFLKSVTINKWTLCFLMDYNMERDSQRGFQESTFSQLYAKIANQKGIRLNPNFDSQNLKRINMNQAEGAAKKEMENYFTSLNQNKVDHVIFFLPDDCPDWTYRYIQYLEVTTGKSRKSGEWWTRSSCIKYSNYQNKIIRDNRGGSMFLNNLWLKYNTKFGGVNFALKPEGSPFLGDGIIFVSVDVCHPAPGDKLSQSVAAVVGMWDITGPNMSHCTSLRVQKKVREDQARQSTIEDVGEIGSMVDEVLLAYREKKKRLPGVIVILRDGVSEGQFKIVLGSEIQKVKANVKNLYSREKSSMPKITCLVVQKRHKVRFMRKEPIVNAKTNRQDYNIQPGTVVDSGITHPTDFAFYLAPHKAIQGTSKAPHIFIVCDELNLSQDIAQSMVHALSYLSPRCTKSTSIPTPVNLADLAAEQAKNLVICWNDLNSGKMSEDERLKKLNSFLSNIGDRNYKNTLYYV